MKKKQTNRNRRGDKDERQQHNNILQNCLPGVTISTSMTSSIRSYDSANTTAASSSSSGIPGGGVAINPRISSGSTRSLVDNNNNNNYLPSNYIISPTTSISSRASSSSSSSASTTVVSVESSPLLTMPSPSSSSSSPHYSSSSMYYVDIQDKSDPTIHLMILEERERRQRHYTTKRYIQCAIIIVVLFVFAKWNNSNNNTTTTTKQHPPVAVTTTTTMKDNNDHTPASTTSFSSGGDSSTAKTSSTTTTTTTTTNHHNQQQQSQQLSQIKDNNNRRDEVLRILKNLDEEIDGDIILESTKPKFLEATKVWQQSLPLPFVIIEPTSENDITKILPILSGLKRDYHVEFRVRSGGHNYAGYSTINNTGIVLSLKNLNSTTILPAAATASTTSNDPKTSTILVEPGVTVEQFLQTTLADGSATSTTSSSSVVADAAGVGMIGFVLGGGYSFMSRKYGLGIDNVISFKVVLINGTSLQTKYGDDLFWALRGSGGGNFGIITEMEYQLHPTEDMKLAAHVKIPFVKLPEFLQKLGQRESKLDHNFVAIVRGYEHYQQHTILSSATTNQQQEQQHSYIRKGVDVTGTTSVVRQPHGSSSVATKSSSSTTTSAAAGSSMMMTENGTVSITFYWAGSASPDNPIGEDYIKKEIVPLLPTRSDDDGSTEDEVDYYYYSWSGTTRQKEQDKTLSSVYAAQSWNGFMFAENNTDIVWEDIRENLSVLFKYCTPYLKPKIELWGGAIATPAAPQNGTIADDDDDDDIGGAFPYRQALYNVGIELYIPVGTDNAKQIFQQQSALIGAVWPSIAQYLQGVYVNFPMPSLTEDEYPKAYWGNNLERLQKLKDQYDPFHVLTFEQSIPTIKSDDNTNSSSKWAAQEEDGGGTGKLR